MNRDRISTTIAKAAAALVLLAPLAYLATPPGAASIGLDHSLALPAAALLAALSLASSIASLSEKASERQAKLLTALSIALPLLAAAFDLAFVFQPMLASTQDGSLYFALLIAFEVVGAIVILHKARSAPFARTILLTLLPAVAFLLSSAAAIAIAIVIAPFVIRFISSTVRAQF